MLTKRSAASGDENGLWQESRALTGPDFLSMRRVSVSYYQPIRFARFDGKSVNCGLPVLDKARVLDSCHRPEGSWALGTRMARPWVGVRVCHLLLLLVQFKRFGCKTNKSNCKAARERRSCLLERRISQEI